jgi:hypothetical protein
MSNGDRTKYDHISGLTVNVTAEEAAIADFIKKNKGSEKVMKLKTTNEKGRSKVSREKKIVSVDETGKPKVRISVFRGARRHLDLEIKTSAQIESEKRSAEREAARAERRAARAAQKSENNS